MSPAPDHGTIAEQALADRGGFRGIGDWLGAHLSVVIAFAVGCLGGVIIALPIIGSVLDGSVATLLGTFLGAAVTVAGAGMVATSSSRREAALIRVEVLGKLAPLLRCKIPDASIAQAPREQLSPMIRRDLFDLAAAAEFAMAGIDELNPVLVRRADIFVCTTMIQNHARTVRTYARQAGARVEAIQDGSQWSSEEESREDLRVDLNCVAHAMGLLRNRVMALP